MCNGFQVHGNLQRVPSVQKWAAGSKRRKTGNVFQAWENRELVPSAGKRAAAFKRAKAGSVSQERGNVQRAWRARRQVACSKRAKTCSKLQRVKTWYHLTRRSGFFRFRFWFGEVQCSSSTSIYLSNRYQFLQHLLIQNTQISATNMM